MPNEETLTILLLTYDRFDYAVKTLSSMLGHVIYRGPVRLHIADDGSPSEYVPSLLEEVKRQVGDLPPTTVSNANRGGYGASFNLASQIVHAQSTYVLPLEDDWQCYGVFDIDRFTPALQDHNGCVRFGYLGFTQELHGSVVRHGHESYLAIDPDSAEPHVWAGHPRLETVAYQKRVGPWPEGVEPGETEFLVAHRREAREGVLWPLSNLPNGSFFSHIGTFSWRNQHA